MSWTDVFPVLMDEQVDEYLAKATPQDAAMLDEWFGVERVINPREGSHLVATSLFWKRRYEDEEDLPPVTREMMKNATKLGLATRFAPWEHYVLPLLEGAWKLKASPMDAVLRIYLAADLEFLVDDFVKAGCEIYLMKSSSVRHNPGAMWRFLALEEPPERWVTITDADRARFVLSDLERSEMVQGAGLGMWRVPYFFDRQKSDSEPTNYKPVNACQFGARGGLPVGQMLRAFVWQTLQGTMKDTASVMGGQKEAPLSGTRWPDYGFDEWFLLAAYYPRIAAEGVLTFIACDEPMMNHWLALDVEYATWSNPNSEMFYFHTPAENGADTEAEKAEDGTTKPDPWATWTDPEPLKVRPHTHVYRRLRKRIGAGHGIHGIGLGPGMRELQSFHGSLPALLDTAAREVAEEWWVDLNPELRMSPNGAELFLDRSFEAKDVVFCGWFFIRVDATLAAWAAGRGLDAVKWSEGRLLKVPKLEGPMTLWRTDLSRSFHKEARELPAGVRTEVLMKAWIEEGRVRPAEVTAKQYGWAVR